MPKGVSTKFWREIVIFVSCKSISCNSSLFDFFVPTSIFEFCFHSTDSCYHWKNWEIYAKTGGRGSVIDDSDYQLIESWKIAFMAKSNLLSTIFSRNNPEFSWLFFFWPKKADWLPKAFRKSDLLEGSLRVHIYYSIESVNFLMKFLIYFSSKKYRQNFWTTGFSKENSNLNLPIFVIFLTVIPLGNTWLVVKFPSFLININLVLDTTKQEMNKCLSLFYHCSFPYYFMPPSSKDQTSYQFPLEAHH